MGSVFAMTRPVFRSRLPTRARGQVLIIFGLTLVVLIAAIGIAIDLGRMFVTKTELQNAADACALGAARELDGLLTSLLRAENAGFRVARENKVEFQSAAINPPTVSNIQIAVTFSDSLSPNSGYQPKETANATTARYAMCTVQRDNIAMLLMQVLGWGNQSIPATAVATLAPAQSNCAIPLGVCDQSAVATGPCPNGSARVFGLCKGDWVSGRFDSGGGLTGSFNWLDFTPPAGGASELVGLLEGAGLCNLNVTNPVGQTGILGNAAGQAFNSRFGLYQGGPGNCGANGAPDFTGYAYTNTSWSAGRDALADFLQKRNAWEAYQGDAATGLTLPGGVRSCTGGAGEPPSELKRLGADRRLVTAAIVNCQAWATSQTIPVLDWVCMLMLHPISSPGDTVFMEFRGKANELGNPCSSYGLGGGSGSQGPLVPVLVQ